MQNKTFGESVRARRKELGLTAEELAKKAGIVRTYVSRIEKHNIIPTLNVVLAIARGLKEDPDEYFRMYHQIKYPTAQKFARIYCEEVTSKAPFDEKILTELIRLTSKIEERIAETKDGNLRKRYIFMQQEYKKLLLRFLGDILTLLSTIEPQKAKSLKAKYLSAHN